MNEIIYYEVVSSGDAIVIATTSGTAKYIHKTEIVDLFNKYGGSFIIGLGTALLHADPLNGTKILTYWENEVKEYITKFKLNGKQI